MGDIKKPIKVDQTDLQILQLSPKKQEFIEYYRRTLGHISDSTRAIGVSRQTYYDWLNNDNGFALAIAEAEAELNDDMRKALIDKGAGGDLGAIIFWLKNRHPDFKQSRDGVVAVQVNFNDLAGKQKDEYGI